MGPIVFLTLLILFVSVPLVELALLLQVARITSPVATVLLVLCTGIVGATLARRQGLKTWFRIQDDLAAGRLPADSLVDAAMIFVAGAVLLTPGILTDVFGFSLLVPRIRRWYRSAATRYFKNKIHIRTTHFEQNPFAAQDDDVIDSHVVDERDEVP